MPKNNEISEEKLDKYFSITKKALTIAKESINAKRRKEALTLLSMAQHYFDDASWFREKGDIVNAFASLNYAHGWIDSGSKLGLFLVKDNKLFVLK